MNCSIRMVVRNVRLYGPVIILCAIFGLGCQSPKKNPLVGWKFKEFDKYTSIYDQHHYQLPQIVIVDYESFIQKHHLDLFGPINGFYENEGGEYAVAFMASPISDTA